MGCSSSLCSPVSHSHPLHVGLGMSFFLTVTFARETIEKQIPLAPTLSPNHFFLFYMDPIPCGQLCARPHCFCVSFADDTPDCLALVFGSPAIAWGYVFLIVPFSQQAHTRHSMLACNAKSNHCCWEPTSLCWCLDAQYHLTEQNTGCGNEQMRETKKRRMDGPHGRAKALRE